MTRPAVRGQLSANEPTRAFNGGPLSTLTRSGTPCHPREGITGIECRLSAQILRTSFYAEPSGQSPQFLYLRPTACPLPFTGSVLPPMRPESPGICSANGGVLKQMDKFNGNYLPGYRMASNRPWKIGNFVGPDGQNLGGTSICRPQNR